ncbi:ABC transporter ATP-binding protein [Halobellus salinus]|uniref:ABC-type D-xylose/L-arabinose transporter n=1 Tax=Halobellus salinus TaxID=931585 RepID=A0A830EHE8_9EURY|nr:sn-glycerol-3-phosphate ABC transporter ATP-binding protein UgpC [Halobellus salinus]GGJ10412.1 ABC transporter ATP-binding protein [Halobellus salinus]SMP24323.1 multiple sugar transport system ATP-binding protein [Halobellus salinus]
MGRLDIRQLTKTFDEGENVIVAVDELDITVEDGDFLVLVGPSGCGKSTTLRCIAGLERATSGRIRLDGRDITDAKPKNRDMAMVFQNYALYPHMTVRRNIGYGLKITTDLDSSEINDRVEDTAALLEIPDLLDKKPKELSGGQQQRVALGRAIIREPEVFLMDEPLSNLDAKLRTTMRTEIQQLQQDMGVTTIYVTHDQTEAMTMGDKIAVLDGGELQQLGTPLECYHEPTNQFVAGFIGSPSMNFIDVERSGDTLEAGAFSYQISSETRNAVDTASSRLTMGIRPEHIELGTAEEPNAVATEIEVVEPMGEMTYAYFTVGGATHTASIDGERRTVAGEQVHVVFPEDKIHLFDQADGAAIKNSNVDRLGDPSNHPEP